MVYVCQDENVMVRRSVRDGARGIMNVHRWGTRPGDSGYTLTYRLAKRDQQAEDDGAAL